VRVTRAASLSGFEDARLRVASTRTESKQDESPKPGTEAAAASKDKVISGVDIVQ
jgi:hypothetical protein